MPASPHAVCVSLPTMRDVVGYETRDSSTMDRIRTGYPRFVTHPFSAQAGEWFAETKGLRDRAVFTLNSSRLAKSMEAFLDSGPCEVQEVEGMTFVHLPDSEEARLQGKLFLQHTGCGASSRRLEDLLIRVGCLDHAHAEDRVEAGGADLTRQGLADSMEGVESEDVLLATSGMNAFYSLFEAIRETRSSKGRKVWVQLGWLYVDTMLVLEKLLREDEESIALREVSDIEPLRRLLEERGEEVAAVVAETPTNPLLQTCDLTEIRTLCDKHDVLLVADPSAVSPLNVNPLPVCDVLVNSLTKYTGNEGDAMLGCLVFSPFSEADDLPEIRDRVQSRLESPFEGDLNRLAWQMPAWEQVVQRSNQSCMELVAFLEGRPEVRKVHWTYADEFRASYESIALGPDSPGCLFSVELTVPLASFYDKLQLLKSPSFGTKFSMACPYLYLAHYDLVSNEKGRSTLLRAGLEPDLLRVSVGTEEPDRLIEVFAEAFRLAARD